MNDEKRYRLKPAEKREQCYEKTVSVLCIFAAAVFVLLLIPILAASFSAHTVNDDYNFAWRVYHAVRGGSGPIGILAAAVQETVYIWQIWQGTFSAVFLFSLSPGAFSERAYALTTWILLGSLILATFYCVHTVVREKLRGSRAESALICASVLTVSVSFVPDKAEAYYWWNGAVYYTFFYALSLLLGAVVLQLLQDPGPENVPTDPDAAGHKMQHVSRVPRGRRRRLLTAGCLLGFLVGGGNYTSALLCTECLALVLLWCILTKNRKWREILPVLVFLVFAFAVSLSSPGAAERSGRTEGMAPLQAVLSALRQAAVFTLQWTDLTVIALLLFLLPVMVHLAKKSGRSFRHPLPAVLLSYLLFASQIAPSYYGVSTYGGGRQVDIYYYSYILAAVGLTFYLTGWLMGSPFGCFFRGCRKGRSAGYEKSAAGASAPAEEKKTNARRGVLVLWSGKGLLLLCIVFLIGCKISGLHSITSVAAGDDLVHGRLAAYDREYMEMAKELEQGQGKKSVTVSAPTAQPSVFPVSEIETYPGGWVNKAMERYYGIEQIQKRENE